MAAMQAFARRQNYSQVDTLASMARDWLPQTPRLLACVLPETCKQKRSESVLYLIYSEALDCVKVFESPTRFAKRCAHIPAVHQSPAPIDEV